MSSRVSRAQLAWAVDEVRGNVTCVAALLQISVMQTHRLLKLYELREYARDLRLEAGVKATGRPRGQVKR